MTVKHAYNDLNDNNEPIFDPVLAISVSQIL